MLLSIIRNCSFKKMTNFTSYVIFFCEYNAISHFKCDRNSGSHDQTLLLKDLVSNSFAT